MQNILRAWTGLGLPHAFFKFGSTLDKVAFRSGILFLTRNNSWRVLFQGGLALELTKFIANADSKCSYEYNMSIDRKSSWFIV